MQKNQKILVTGGAGFIGSFLCEKLLEKEQLVTCVDNFSTGKKENIGHLLNNKNFTLIEADISRENDYSKFSADYNYILHLASPAGPNPESPKSYHKLWQETYLANTYGTHLLCNLAREKKSTFLFASSSEVYGDPKEHPQTEEYTGNVNTIGPRSIYDESKRLGESIVANFTRHSELETRIIRIFNTYGPRMNVDDGRALPLFIYQTLRKQPITVYGDGNQTRSFCYVDDQVDGILKLVECRDANALPVNIGNPAEITINELLEEIKKIAGELPEVIFRTLPQDDPLKRKPDIIRAQKLLGWQPSIPLDLGLQKTFSYFKETTASDKNG